MTQEVNPEFEPEVEDVLRQMPQIAFGTQPNQSASEGAQPFARALQGAASKRQFQSRFEHCARVELTPFGHHSAADVAGRAPEEGGPLARHRSRQYNDLERDRGNVRVIVYRSGRPTVRQLTPRPDKDLQAGPGQVPGLSATSEKPGVEHYCIDLDRLKTPLRAIPDDPDEGGEPGHVTITAVDDHGEVDEDLLKEWAAHREQGTEHYLTRLLTDAIVDAS